MKSECVCVIGGTNVDITATPYSGLINGDSVPGKSNMFFGGVGRNIAENLVRLGLNVNLITAIGDDVNSINLQNDCKLKNISMTGSLQLKNTDMSTYICINDNFGEMQYAVSSMDIYNYITPEYISNYMDFINSASVCIIDTNIPQETISYIIKNCKVPLFVDTVSVNKAKKIKNSLSNIYTLKPNLLEAELLTGIKIRSHEDLKRCANELLNKGIKNVYISMGKDGIFCTDGKIYELIPCFNVKVVNTTGAGDSFLSALVYSYIKNFDIVSAAKLGLAASSLCISSNMPVSDQLSYETLRKLLENQEANYEY